jgi:hypothetical protein
MDLSAIIKRTSNIIIKPDEEWQVILQENANKNKTIFGFAIPYIVVIAIATAIGNYFFSLGFFSISYISISIAVALVVPFSVIYISAYIINALAPSFKSTPNIDRAFNLVIYSYTASFLAAIITGIFPMLTFIGIAGLYSFYIFWTGFTPMMDTPSEKRVGYVIISILIILGVYIVLTFLFALILASFITGIGIHI